MFWRSRRRQAREGEPTSNTLSDITRGMQHAVNAAQEISEQQHMRMIDRFFEDGKPITTDFQLPTGHVMRVPFITLVPVASLGLKNVSVELSVRIDEAKPTIAVEPKGKDFEIDRTSFKISLAPQETSRGGRRGGDVVDIRMEFVSGDPPEGVARIVEQFTHTLAPIPLTPLTPATTVEPTTETGGETQAK